MRKTAQPIKKVRYTIAWVLLLSLVNIVTAAQASDPLDTIFVTIVGGKYWQGAQNDIEDDLDVSKPLHQVEIDDFAISKYEVTVAQFRRFVQQTAYLTDAERNVAVWSKPAQGCWSHSSEDKASTSWVAQHTWTAPGFEQSDSHPVVCVSWNDAIAYLKWSNFKNGTTYRLPTESEFEYLSKKDQNSLTTWEQSERLCEWTNHADRSLRKVFPNWKSQASTCEDGYPFSAPVGHYQIDANGIFDLTGNVSEWISDCWHDSYVAAPDDGSSWEMPPGEKCRGRVLRGGDFTSPVSQLRPAYRTWIPESFRTYHGGFRIASDL